MKPPALFLIIAAGLLSASDLRSQTAAPAAARTPQQALQALKAQNQKLLEQQGAALQKLEDLQKASHQLRILARRT